jgi:hypothetical protein
MQDKERVRVAATNGEPVEAPREPPRTRWLTAQAGGGTGKRANVAAYLVIPRDLRVSQRWE